MADDSPKYNLLQTLIRISGFPWYLFTSVLSVSLILFFILAAFLDGSFSSLSHWDFWRQFLGAPVIIAYIFMIYPYMRHLGENAVQAFLKLRDEQCSESGNNILLTPKRPWEWVSIITGIVFWILLLRPWEWQWGVDAWWLYVYNIISFSILFGLLSWLIYDSLVESHYLNRLSRQKLKLNIFETSALVPVARSSLSVTFAFIGGISLSLVFQTVESLLNWTNITIYSLLVIATVFIFFFSLWSTHRTMSVAKHNELSMVQEHLEELIRKMRESSILGPYEVDKDVFSAVAAWGIYERRVRDIREWPFNAGILRRLAASILIPGIVYLIKVLIGLPLGLL